MEREKIPSRQPPFQFPVFRCSSTYPCWLFGHSHFHIPTVSVSLNCRPRIIIPGLKFFKPSNTWSLRIFRAFGNALLLESFPKFCENPIVESATCARVIKYTMVWRDVSDLQYILQCCLDSFAGKRHFCGWWIHGANAKRFFNKTFSDVLGHVAGTYPLSHNPGIWAFKISSMKKNHILALLNCFWNAISVLFDLF